MFVLSNKSNIWAIKSFIGQPSHWMIIEKNELYDTITILAKKNERKQTSLGAYANCKIYDQMFQCETYPVNI